MLLANVPNCTQPLIAEGLNTADKCLICLKQLLDIIESNTKLSDAIENCAVYNDTINSS